MDTRDFEKKVWFEIFNKVCSIMCKYLRDVSDWPRVKLLIAEVIADVISRYFKTIEYIGVTELSGGEYVSDYEGGFDIDMLFKVSSEAEAYALKMLEPLIDNAIKEAVTYMKDREFFRRMGMKYGKGISHNVVEFHVNDDYVDVLMKSKQSLTTTLYRRT